MITYHEGLERKVFFRITGEELLEILTIVPGKDGHAKRYWYTREGPEDISPFTGVKNTPGRFAIEIGNIKQYQVPSTEAMWNYALAHFKEQAASLK